jgi:hypothetical protein
LARYTEILAVDKPFADSWRAVHAALIQMNWRIVNVRDNTFFVRERLSFETMLWRNPCRFAVHVAGDGDTRSKIHLIGATLGFGPLAKGRVRRVGEGVKTHLLGVLSRLEPAPPE